MMRFMDSERRVVDVSFNLKGWQTSNYRWNQ